MTILEKVVENIIEKDCPNEYGINEQKYLLCKREKKQIDDRCKKCWSQEYREEKSNGN